MVRRLAEALPCLPPATPPPTLTSVLSSSSEGYNLHSSTNSGGGRPTLSAPSSDFDESWCFGREVSRARGF